jgi:hypothetical protein
MTVNRINRTRQKGLSLILLVVGGGLVVFLAIEFLRIYPALFEYYQVEKAIVASTQRSNDPVGIRKSFDSYAAINNIEAVAGQDLVIEKTASGGYVASVSYTSWTNLFKNVNLVIEFSATSQPTLGGQSGKERKGID